LVVGQLANEALQHRFQRHVARCEDAPPRIWIFGRVEASTPVSRPSVPARHAVSTFRSGSTTSLVVPARILLPPRSKDVLGSDDRQQQQSRNGDPLLRQHALHGGQPPHPVVTLLPCATLCDVVQPRFGGSVAAGRMTLLLPIGARSITSLLVSLDATTQHATARRWR
jgi:hypothetical protein